MTKPHEQQLEHDGRGSVWVRGSAAAMRHEPPTGHAMSPEEVLAYGALFAAAPAMARALLAPGEPTMADDLPCWCFMQASDGTHRKQCERVRALLKEAGVLE